MNLHLHVFLSLFRFSGGLFCVSSRLISRISLNERFCSRWTGCSVWAGGAEWMTVSHQSTQSSLHFNKTLRDGWSINDGRRRRDISRVLRQFPATQEMKERRDGRKTPAALFWLWCSFMSRLQVIPSSTSSAFSAKCLPSKEVEEGGTAGWLVLTSITRMKATEVTFGGKSSFSSSVAAVTFTNMVSSSGLCSAANIHHCFVFKHF